MKRSKSVTLALMGSAAVVLAGCGEEPPPPQAVFSGIEQCIRAGNEVETCAAEYKEAVEQHATQAPRFASAQECEVGADSQCEPTRVQNADGSWSNVFVPLMAGYMISNAINNMGGGRGYRSTPVYNSRAYSGQQRDLSALRGSGAATSAVATGASRSVGSTTRPATRALPPPNVRTTTVSRGGFGGFGGGRSSGA